VVACQSWLFEFNTQFCSSLYTLIQNLSLALKIIFHNCNRLNVPKIHTSYQYHVWKVPPKSPSEWLKEQPKISPKMVKIYWKSLVSDMVVHQNSIGNLGFGGKLLSSNHNMIYIFDKLFLLSSPSKHVDNFHWFLTSFSLAYWFMSLHFFSNVKTHDCSSICFPSHILEVDLMHVIAMIFNVAYEQFQALYF